MKTKIFLSSFCMMIFLIFSCQKEEIITSKSEPSAKINPLAEIAHLIPENVEVFPMEKTFLQENDNNIFPISTIDLTDCEQQSCFNVIPGRLRQMQRVADHFCTTISINICCCAKGQEWCFQFKVNPRFVCNEVEVPRTMQLLPEDGIQSESN